MTVVSEPEQGIVAGIVPYCHTVTVMRGVLQDNGQDTAADT